MKKFIVLSAFLLALTVVVLMMPACSGVSDDSRQPATGWQSPSEALLQVLHAPQLPWMWIAPTGDYMLLADPTLYPPLAELAAPKHKLAGMRVNPAINGYHGRHGATSPRLVRIEDGVTTPLNLPEAAEVDDMVWTVDRKSVV